MCAMPITRRRPRRPRDHLPERVRRELDLLSEPREHPDRPVLAHDRGVVEPAAVRGVRRVRRHGDDRHPAPGGRLHHRPRRQVPERLLRRPTCRRAGTGGSRSRARPRTASASLLRLLHERGRRPGLRRPRLRGLLHRRHGRARPIGSSTTRSGPLFLQFAPTAPHIPGDAGRGGRVEVSDLPPWRPPGYNEEDVADKPKWVRDLPKLGPNVIPTIRPAPCSSSCSRSTARSSAIVDALERDRPAARTP